MPAWNFSCSPNVGASSNQLNAVAAVSASDVWAVGYAIPSPSTGVSQTLTEQWNGTSWSVVKSPNVGTLSKALNAVAVVSESSIWAVGSTLVFNGGNEDLQTLIEHWNGSSWSVVQSPSPGTSTNQLNSVAVVSATDIWAVGFFFTTGGLQETLTEQWNGSSWKVVSSPNIGSQSLLYGVAVVSESSIWAVGNYFNTTFSNFETLTEQWNGTSWNVVKSLSDGTGTVGNNLLGVAAITATNVWTAGYEINSGSVSQTLIEQYCC